MTLDRWREGLAWLRLFCVVFDYNDSFIQASGIARTDQYLTCELHY